MHLPDHTQNIMFHSQPHVLIGVTQALNHTLGDAKVLVGLFTGAEFLERGIGHPFHRLFGDGGEAMLRPLQLTNGRGKRRSLAIIVYKVPGVTRIVRSGQGLLESHDGIARFLASNLTDLTEHEILDVGPFHAKVYNIALYVHASTAGAALHLLCNQGSQGISHVTTEDTRTEGHIDTVSKSIIGKDDGNTTVLGQHLHLTTVARETNFIGIDGDTTPETTDERVVNIDLFAGLPHIGNDVLDLVEIEALTRRGKHILIMRLGGVLLDQRRVFKSGLCFLFGLGSVDSVRLAGGNLAHGGLFPRKLYQVSPVRRELGNLLAL
mmetsp:Transcript_25151/g.54903  ORF Transcript_25151/g.54903 Transcript_25151/m.54903 type:complete len:322 (-) Transcript_25151:2271-3236(-)